MFGKSTRSAKDDSVVIADTAPCKKSLRIHVRRETITPVRERVLAEFQKEAVLPGFRKGKAPVDLIERQHGKSIHDETLQRVTRQAFEDAANAHHLKPVGPFEVQVANFTEADGLTLDATVEVEPSFALGAYKGIALKAELLEVTPQEMDQALAKLRESMAQLVPAAEGQAKERRLPAFDDELAKDLGLENLEKLREHVRAKLLEQKRHSQRETQEAALCDELLARHTCEVPPRLVERQTQRLTRDFTVRLLLSGVPEEKAQEQTATFAEQLRTSAARHVKLGFILERIAEQESIGVTQDEVVGRLWELSKRWKKDPAEVRKLFDTQGLWPSVISTIRQEKTMTFLLSAATLEHHATSTAS